MQEITDIKDLELYHFKGRGEYDEIKCGKMVCNFIDGMYQQYGIDEPKTDKERLEWLKENGLTIEPISDIEKDEILSMVKLLDEIVSEEEDEEDPFTLDKDFTDILEDFTTRQHYELSDEGYYDDLEENEPKLIRTLWGAISYIRGRDDKEPSSDYASPDSF